jgi:hypothetical protein
MCRFAVRARLPVEEGSMNMWRLLLTPALAARDPRRGAKRMMLLLLVLHALYISYPPTSPSSIRSGSPEPGLLRDPRARAAK